LVGLLVGLLLGLLAGRLLRLLARLVSRLLVCSLGFGRLLVARHCSSLARHRLLARLARLPVCCWLVSLLVVCLVFASLRSVAVCLLGFACLSVAWLSLSLLRCLPVVSLSVYSVCRLVGCCLLSFVVSAVVVCHCCSLPFRLSFVIAVIIARQFAVCSSLVGLSLSLLAAVGFAAARLPGWLAVSFARSLARSPSFRWLARCLAFARRLGCSLPVRSLRVARFARSFAAGFARQLLVAVGSLLGSLGCRLLAGCRCWPLLVIGCIARFAAVARLPGRRRVAGSFVAVARSSLSVVVIARFRCQFARCWLLLARVACLLARFGCRFARARRLAVCQFAVIVASFVSLLRLLRHCLVVIVVIAVSGYCCCSLLFEHCLLGRAY
jgi:hypothetical protein